ncbi:MAG: single-stranded-DNA-specific exonuclease RecJ [Microcoleaceae cyanobacterium]
MTNHQEQITIIIMWQVPPDLEIPGWMKTEIRRHAPQIDGRYIAQLLLRRGIQSPEELWGFLDPKSYQPSSPFEFGEEMNRAVERIKLARERHETVVIWGDFDADGVTATAVLWEGLQQIFPQSNSNNYCLSYYIPNRLTESHGLNYAGIDRLFEQGCNLMITCDTGSTNLSEIEYANRLGIDIIITDHHTLPEERPAVISIINPRYLSLNHPLYHLSGVAVAYKLIEALYETLPQVPQQHEEALLDLVAIGLIADLVQLTGDCRYLAQKGIEQLQKQLKNSTRPGIAKLLDLCKKTGDRPTDISFGLGPRINAVSRIQGDAHFCVELLTSRDKKYCEKLALETELANTRRKVLQKDVAIDIAKKLAKQDLSTTEVIVLSDPQWPTGILGLVASQIAQEYQKPTILLTEDIYQSPPIARGSARSVQQIDLYELVKTQAHLLEKFGGHPFAAGLCLKLDNLSLFIEGINRQLRQQKGVSIPEKKIASQPDICCTVSELGQPLFKELKLLEPCGMGNPVPKILIKNCYFTNAWNKNQRDFKGGEIKYIKTRFNIWDDTCEAGFPGIWWGHYKDELEEEQYYDAVVELDFNAYDKKYEVRLIDLVLPAENISQSTDFNYQESIEIIDLRSIPQPEQINDQSLIIINKCPRSWQELQSWYSQAILTDKKLAIAYSNFTELQPIKIWEKLIGIAKYISRTQQSIPYQTLAYKLEISEIPLQLGLESLQQLGFEVKLNDNIIHINQKDRIEQIKIDSSSSIQAFLDAVQEEQFMCQYFSSIPIETLNSMASQNLTKSA